MATIITLHRTDLGVPSVDITASEFERCTDIIERELDNAGIDWQTASFAVDRWNLRIEDGADVDSAKAIIDRAIDGGFGQWADYACVGAAVDHLRATRGRSGKTWWGEGFAGVDGGVMADVGWLIQLGRADAAGCILDAATSSLDEDIADDDLREIAEATFGLAQRVDGTWYNERFNALPTDAVVHAGRMLRRGDEEEAVGILIDSDEADDEMDDEVAIAIAVLTYDADHDEEADTYHAADLRGRQGVPGFLAVPAEAMAHAGRLLHRGECRAMVAQYLADRGAEID